MTKKLVKFKVPHGIYVKGDVAAFEPDAIDVIAKKVSIIGDVAKADAALPAGVDQATADGFQKAVAEQDQIFADREEAIATREQDAEAKEAELKKREKALAEAEAEAAKAAKGAPPKQASK